MVHFGYVPAAADTAAASRDRDALTAAGCDEIVAESTSGRRTRIALVALLERLQPGDRLTIGTIAHMAHSLSDFHRIGRQILGAGAELSSLAENFDSRTELGRATLRMLAAFSQFEVEQIATSTKQGLAAARARGERLGRPRTLSPSAEAEIRMKLEQGELIKELARHYRVSPTTIRRIRAQPEQSDVSSANGRR